MAAISCIGTFFEFVSFQSAFWRKKTYFKYNEIQEQAFKLLFFTWKIYLGGKKGFLNS